jgi:hypothetical protein
VKLYPKIPIGMYEVPKIPNFSALALVFFVSMKINKIYEKKKNPLNLLFI